MIQSKNIVELEGLNIKNAIRDNKEQAQSFAISIKYNCNGNTEIINESRDEIAKHYNDKSPTATKIFDEIKTEGQYITGGIFPLIFIIYKQLDGYYADRKFIDIIYEETPKIKIVKKHRILKIDDDGTCIFELVR